MHQSQLTTATISLEHVWPDPAQPRRLLPQDLTAKLAKSMLPADVLEEARTRAKRDRWLRERLAKLDALADSIGADGLMQPIRVYQEGENRYRIEAGERRWWAHHVLVGRGRHEFRQIAAILVTTCDDDRNLLRRRVAENVHRSEFTALELARAMSQRVQEILANEPGTKRREAERQVGQENQMSDRRVRQYVALLSLPPEVQEFAQQARLTENALRALLGIKDAAKQLERARQLAEPYEPAHHSRARSEKLQRKKSLARHKKVSKGRTTKKRLSPRAAVTYQHHAPASISQPEDRGDIIRSLDAIVEAGRVLSGIQMTESEKHYWQEQLGDELVSHNIRQLAILLDDAKSGTFVAEPVPSTSTQEVE